MIGNIMMNQGAICPGQKTLLNPSLGKNYLRAVFMVEWMGAMPGVEEFFLHEHRIAFNPDGKAALEKHVAGLLRSNARDAVYSVTYLCYEGFQMTDDQVTDAGWRFIVGEAG